MTHHPLAPWLCGLGLLAVTACASPATAVTGYSTSAGIDLGPSSRVASTKAAADAVAVALRTSAAKVSQPSGRALVQLAHDGHADAHAAGVVNAVDPSRRTINLTHEPIPSIGWPSMTMDFPVAPSVDLNAVNAGAQVNFTIEKGKNGMYEIQSVKPAGARR